MKQFKQILVAFDGSPDSMKALEVAETFVKNNDSVLTVGYVMERPPSGPVGGPVPSTGNQYSETGTFMSAEPVVPHHVDSVNDGNIAQEDDLPEKMFDRAKNKLARNINVSYESLYGKPDEALTDFATANDIDLIIIGNRGFSGIKKLFMGSVSQKVTNHAECAVMVVK
ncbi:MAG TPA: universal stress protein [Bacillota bacterium]|nr:universal stress protein [Bacillota bacterium]